MLDRGLVGDQVRQPHPTEPRATPATRRRCAAAAPSAASAPSVESRGRSARTPAPPALRAIGRGRGSVAASASDISRNVSPDCQLPSAATMAPCLAQASVGHRARAKQQRLVAERVRFRQRQRGVDLAVAHEKQTRVANRQRAPRTFAGGASGRRVPRRRPAALAPGRTTAGRAARLRWPSAAGVAPGRPRASRRCSAPDT